DFAYAVHTEVGHKTMGARVNGRLVALDTELKNGDSVEVVTSKDENAGPSRDWLGFVKSPRARSKIRQWFSKERREEEIDDGREKLARAMRRHTISAAYLMSQDTLKVAAKALRMPTITAQVSANVLGVTSAPHVVQQMA